MAQTLVKKKQKRRFIIAEDAWYTMQQYAQIAYDKDKDEISGMLCLRKIDHPISGDRVWEFKNNIYRYIRHYKGPLLHIRDKEKGI